MRLIMHCFMYRIIISFSGQERYRSLAPMYYRGAAAAIVVYDITKKVFLAPVTVVECVDFEPLHIRIFKSFYSPLDR